MANKEIMLDLQLFDIFQIKDIFFQILYVKFGPIKFKKTSSGWGFWSHTGFSLCVYSIYLVITTLCMYIARVPCVYLSFYNYSRD